VDEAVVPSQPTSDRLGVWLLAFVGSVVLGIVLGSPWWIPELQVFVDAVVFCLMLAAAVASIAAFNAARHRIRKRVSARWRWLAYFFLAVPMLVVLSFGALITVFAVAGGPFGATYNRQVHFAELDTTIYLYDSSFLDPETTVYRRRGWLPLRDRVMSLRKAPDAVDVVLRGNVVMIEGQALDLRDR